MEFRAEVLAARRRRRNKQVARRPRSSWAQQVTRTLGLLGFALIIGLGAIPSSESVSGEAVVRDLRTRIAHAPVAGAVASVHVEPGEQVEAGQLLLQLRDPVIEVEHAAAAKRAEQALVAALRERSGAGAERSPSAAIDELVRSHAALELYGIRAERAGMVAGVRVAPGDEVDARTPLLSLSEPGPPALVAAIELSPEAIEKVELGDEVLVSFGEGHGSKRRFEVSAMAMEAVAAPESDPRAEPGQSSWRVLARYADARPDRAPPKPGMRGRAELIYGKRSLLAALAAILWNTENS